MAAPVVEESNLEQIKKQLPQKIQDLMDDCKKDPGASSQGQVIPVGVLPIQISKKIESNATTVFISKETMKKQLKKHPDITLEQYCNIQWILDNAEVVKEGRGSYKRHILF